MSAFEIEEVRNLDAVWPDVVALFEELHDYHVPLDEPPLVSGWQGKLRAQFSGPDRMALLARVNGEVVGLMNARIQRATGLYDESYGFIENAFLKDEHRGCGIAQAMLSRTEEWVQRHRIGLIRLSVNAQNELALHFWDKSGFKPMLHILSKTLSGATA